VESVAFAAARAAGVARVAVSSLANEQFCYLTTPEEYALQRYEGGNTLYGPQSEPFVTALAGRAVRDVLGAGGLQEHLAERTFEFAARRYLAVPTGRHALRVAGPVSYVDPTATEDGYWRFEWLDAAPGDLTWHEPLARVETLGADGGWRPASGPRGPIDDQGWALGVSHLGPAPGGAHRYAACWYTPYLGPEGRFRIAVADGRSGWDPASPPLC
jgi:neutral ceramidase